MEKIKLQEKFEKLFEPQIIYRGINYFKEKRVKLLYKSENEEWYKAKVTCNELYNVDIKVKDDSISMECDCPYNGHCKHQYAVLMSIDAKKYKNINLLPVPEKEYVSTSDLIDLIPKEEIIAYIKESFKYDEQIDEDEFREYFKGYRPELSKEYLYNSLYNDFILDEAKIYELMELAQEVLEKERYSYTFKIISSILDAAKDANYKDDESVLLSCYNKISIFLRIAYRKGSKELKAEMDKWIEKYKKNDYYKDMFLEDVILQIK